MRPFLEISDVTVRFRPGQPATLRRVTLPVQKGEWVSIIGH